jgi:choline dehydrogenase-like flavoprotein
VPDADVVIVGSGMGGATVAAALAPSGRRILILERGERLVRRARGAGCRGDLRAQGHYRPDETWLTPDGERFNPGNYACVGGNTKFYGAVLMRYRAEDFASAEPYGRREPGLAVDL